MHSSVSVSICEYGVTNWRRLIVLDIVQHHDWEVRIFFKLVFTTFYSRTSYQSKTPNRLWPGITHFEGIKERSKVL